MYITNVNITVILNVILAEAELCVCHFAAMTKQEYQSIFFLSCKSKKVPQVSATDVFLVKTVTAFSRYLSVIVFMAEMNSLCHPMVH